MREACRVKGIFEPGVAEGQVIILVSCEVVELTTPFPVGRFKIPFFRFMSSIRGKINEFIMTRR